MSKLEFIIPADLLLSIVKAAHSHASKRDDRSVVSGILLEIEPETREIRVVATDGYRLYARSLPKEEQTSGQFPNFRQIMPESYKHAVTVDRKALLAACKAMPGRAFDGSPIKLTLNGHVEIHGTDKTGDHKLSQTIGLAGDHRHPGDEPETEISFNSGYLSDSLRAMESAWNAGLRSKEKKLPDTVTLRVNSPVNVAILTAGDEDSAESEGVTALLMPIRP